MTFPGLENDNFKIPWLFQVFHDRTNPVFGLVKTPIQHFERQHRKWCKSVLRPLFSTFLLFPLWLLQLPHPYSLPLSLPPPVVTPSVPPYPKTRSSYSFKSSREECVSGEGEEICRGTLWLGGVIMRLCGLLCAEYFCRTENRAMDSSNTHNTLIHLKTATRIHSHGQKCRYSELLAR